MRPILLLLISCCLLAAGKGQESYKNFYLLKSSFADRMSELKKQFGNNKVIPSEIEPACLAALSFYPELKNTSIKFKFGHISSTMLARPKFNFIFRSKEKRNYVILISYRDNKRTKLDWTMLSFNALVGWIGHELGHVLHAERKKNFGLILTGLQLLIPDFKRKFERQTDQSTIEHHLGFALYEGVDFTLNHSTATKKYKDKQVRFYLSPCEIKHRTLALQMLASLNDQINCQN